MAPKPLKGPDRGGRPPGGVSDSVDTSVEALDDVRGPPPPGRQLKRTDSEGEAAAVARKAAKRLRKSTVSCVAGADGSMESSGPVVAATSVASPSRSSCSGRNRKRNKVRCFKDSEEALEVMQEITERLRDGLFALQVPGDSVRGLLRVADEYAVVLSCVLLENERLRGELGGIRSVGCVAPAAPLVGRAEPAAASVSPVLPKPMETFSAVLRSNDGATSKQIIERVNKEVGPTLKVRVVDVKPTKDGGAVIRTPTIKERDKVLKNEKFGEVGVRVTVGDKLGPRVVVGGVRADIRPDKFMEHLYEMNLDKKFTIEEFKKGVRMVTKPWDLDPEARVNVVLEGTENIIKEILLVGKVFVEWFSFRAYLQDPVQHCFRCLGFNHRVKDCRMKGEVCRMCGQVGHTASRCSNAVWCRNCARVGRPADHPMLSYACPVYAGLVARANARH